jgi:hypothetical protein
VLVNLPFAVRILKGVGIERWKLEEEVSEKESFSLPTGQPQRCLMVARKNDGLFALAFASFRFEDKQDNASSTHRRDTKSKPARRCGDRVTHSRIIS